MNLGTTGVAPPNAASSSTARYSRTAWPGSSGGSHRSPGVEFWRFASALIIDASTAKPPPPTSPFPMQRGTLQQLAEHIALAKATVPVLREGRVVRHRAVQAEPAEPAICEVEVNLLAQAPL